MKTIVELMLTSQSFSEIKSIFSIALKVFCDEKENCEAQNFLNKNFQNFQVNIT